MGTFADYYGDSTIPPELRAEFTARVCTILQKGGMMQLERVALYDKTIGLLFPPEANADGTILFSYNYFEDDFWETAGYNRNQATFFSNKIGWSAFCRVVCAIYVLYEFYTSSFGIAVVDGRIFDGREVIGWINYLFGTQYTNQRASDLWNIYRTLHMQPWSPDQDLFGLLLQNPEATYRKSGLENYLVVKFFDHFKKAAQEMNSDQSTAQEDSLSLVHRVSGLYRILQDYRQNAAEPKEEQLHWLQTLLSQPSREILSSAEGAGDDIHNKIRFWLTMNTPVVALCVMADIFEFDFWPRLEELEKTFSTERPNLFQEPATCPPLPPLPTEDFLRGSDETRIYSWQPGTNLSLSPEGKQSLEHFRQRFDAILAREGVLLLPNRLTHTLVVSLWEALQTYGGIYAFRDTFFEFIEHPNRRRIQAAVLLLQELTAQYQENLPLGRKTIRQYLAVLGNPHLRNGLFSF